MRRGRAPSSTRPSPAAPAARGAGDPLGSPGAEPSDRRQPPSLGVLPPARGTPGGHSPTPLRILRCRALLAPHAAGAPCPSSLPPSGDAGAALGPAARRAALAEPRGPRTPCPAPRRPAASPAPGSEWLLPAAPARTAPGQGRQRLAPWDTATGCFNPAGNCLAPAGPCAPSQGKVSRAPSPESTRTDGNRNSPTVIYPITAGKGSEQPTPTLPPPGGPSQTGDPLPSPSPTPEARRQLLSRRSKATNHGRRTGTPS